MSGSAYAEPQWLVQRGGRYLQLSELLYRIAELADGTHDVPDIAVLVSALTRRNVSADDVRELIASRLAPAGIIARPGAPGPERRADSPLAVRFRAALIGPRVLEPAARALSALYLPGVAIAILAGTIGTRAWLYWRHGISDGAHEVLYEPAWLILLGALAVGSAAFHELGHATALAVAGGRARGMGVGLYLIYPVFYTDVTDSYRLGRWRRVLTDAGGFYFNLVFSLGVLGAYALTRNEALLVAVLFTDLEILHQCLPLGRLDGYWLLADLVGVPDFFSQAGPFVRRIAGRSGAMPKLRPVARLVFGAYLVVIVPVLALLLALLLRNTPRIVVTALDSFLVQAARFDAARAAGDPVTGAIAVGQGILLTLPLLAIGLVVASVLRAIARIFLRLAGRDRRQRALGALSAAAAAALLAALWLPGPLGVANAARVEPIGVEGGRTGDAVRDAGVTATPRSFPAAPPVRPAASSPARPAGGGTPATATPTPSGAVASTSSPTAAATPSPSASSAPSPTSSAPAPTPSAAPTPSRTPGGTP